MIEPVLTSAALTSLALLFLERSAVRLGLVEKPGGHRIHLNVTPVVGGIGMAIGMQLTWLLWMRVHPGGWIAAGAIALLITGIVDDRFGLRARTKFVLQATIAGLALALDGSLLHTLGELLPDHEIRLAAVSALAFTVFAAAGIINGMNMLDGLDGLAGTVALVAVGWFAFAAWSIGDLKAMTDQLSIAGAVAGFLLFNARLPGRARARLFMGDAGSMLLGFLLVWIAIDLSQRPNGLPPVIALWICAMPILDTIAVMLKRRRKGRPLMSAGRDHLHHLLLGSGLSVEMTASVEAALGAIAGGAGITFWLLGWPDWQVLVVFLVTTGAYLHLFLGGWKALRERQARQAQEAAGATAATDFPL